MQKQNYQLQMEKTIQNLNDEKKSLLLHVCCAPCSTAVLEVLSKHFKVTCFYDNPNITQLEEHEKRKEELARFITQMPFENDVQAVMTPYDDASFFACIKGHEQDKEGGERCTLCYRLRLENTARYAQLHQFDYITTTLSVSPYKNAEKLNNIGYEMAQKYNVSYLPSDFKKKGGYLRSVQLSKEYALYRQDYCGCIFSKLEAEKRAKL